MDSAAAAGAVRYALEPYRQAEATLKTGWMELARQNGRLGPFKNYKMADSLLSLAKLQAGDAKRLARTRINDLATRAESERKALFDELLGWREALNGSLVLYKAENYWSAAELGLNICENLLAQKEYDAAIEAVADARQSLKQVGAVLAEEINNQAQMLVQWRNWVQETVSNSRSNGSYALIVDKSAHRAYLIKGGKVTRTYDCELGYNSARQKLFQGDGATPEGKYHVTKARPYGSKYHKALLIDYPNAMDRRRFAENKAKGIISRRAGIGKNIEIHGDGGRNKDWTEGCVALTNEDMKHLMRFVGVGTPVTIVRRCDKWP